MGCICFSGQAQEQRLLGTIVCDVDDFFTETTDMGWLIEGESITLTEPVGITKDDIFRVDVVLLRGTDSKVCGIFHDKKGTERREIEAHGIFFYAEAEAVCPMKRGGQGFELQTVVFIENNLTSGKWEQGEMLITSELYVEVGYYPVEESGVMDTIVPMLFR